MKQDAITTIQMAFGLLWLSPKSDDLTKQARLILRDSLSPDERLQGVNWAMSATHRTENGLEMKP